jgi:hypothetical protein
VPISICASLTITKPFYFNLLLISIQEEEETTGDTLWGEKRLETASKMMQWDKMVARGHC